MKKNNSKLDLNGIVCLVFIVIIGFLVYSSLNNEGIKINSHSTIYSSTVDTIKPICTTSGGSDKWYKTNRTIIIKCSDMGGSGLSTCAGSTMNIVTKTYTSETNKYYVYTVSDKAGNTNTCSARVRIDKTAPKVTFGVNSAPTYARIHDIGVTCTDAGSGVRTIRWAWSKSTIAPSEGLFSYKGCISCGQSRWDDIADTPKNASGLYYLWGMCYDAAGNSTKPVRSTGTYAIDNVGPASPIITRTSSGVAKLTCGSDTGSGLSTSCIRYCITNLNSQCTPQYVGNNGITTNVPYSYKVCAKTVDRLGNSSNTTCIPYYAFQ